MFPRKHRKICSLSIVFLQVVFAGFSAESVAQRVIDCRPKVVITCNAVMRGSKIINLKDIVDAALVESSQNGVSVGAFNNIASLHTCVFVQPVFDGYSLCHIGNKRVASGSS